MDLNKVGKFIAENRNLQSLTQKDLGEFLNINPKTVSKWERGVNAPDIALLTDVYIIYFCFIYCLSISIC